MPEVPAPFLPAGGDIPVTQSITTHRSSSFHSLSRVSLRSQQAESARQVAVLKDDLPDPRMRSRKARRKSRKSARIPRGRLAKPRRPS